MNYEDWVRILNLVGSAVLSYASFRGLQWSKRQARLEERAVADAPVTAPQPRGSATRPSGAQSGPHESSQAAFDRAAAEMAARPYFDRWAYLVFCAGFAITTVASALDIYGHHTLCRLTGGSSRIACAAAAER